eukprot:6181555-Pleurochrysis_carterae.AAC.1
MQYANSSCMLSKRGNASDSSTSPHDTGQTISSVPRSSQYTSCKPRKQFYCNKGPTTKSCKAMYSLMRASIAAAVSK